MAKVLIVEDDEFLKKMYHKKFTVAGFEVDSAEDGEQGLVKMKAFKPDLVLMDIMMPKLNGLDATEKAKADPMIKNIPIMILTNLSGSEDAQAAVKKGAMGFLVKSNYTPSQVVQKVQEALGSSPK